MHVIAQRAGFVIGVAGARGCSGWSRAVNSSWSAPSILIYSTESTRQKGNRSQELVSMSVRLHNAQSILCRVEGYASYKIASRPITHKKHECRGCEWPVEIGVATLNQLCGIQFVCPTQSRYRESERRSPSIDDRCCRVEAMNELSKEGPVDPSKRLGPIWQIHPIPRVLPPPAALALSTYHSSSQYRAPQQPI